MGLQAAVHRIAGESEGTQAVAGHLAGELLPASIRSPSTMRLTRPIARLLGVDGAAGQDHFERARLADQPRQALGPAIARDQAELDLGQAEPRAADAASRKVQASASSSPPPKA